jgi:hypothetical protein
MVLLCSIALRVIWLDRIPGINGDESWFGVTGMLLFTGDFSSLTTPNGRLANPFFVVFQGIIRAGDRNH